MIPYTCMGYHALLLFSKTAIKVVAIEERMIMKRNVVNLLLFFFVLSSCSNRRKIIEAQDSAPCLTNKDHAIALESDGICYGVFKNLSRGELYIFDENNTLLKRTKCSYVKNSAKRKIYNGMSKNAAIRVLGEPAFIDGNRLVYFQKYFGVNFLKIDYGIDRRIFEIRLKDGKVYQYAEKYVSRM